MKSLRKRKNNSLINDITGLVKATGMAKVLEIAEISETDMLKEALHLNIRVVLEKYSRR